MEGKVGEAMAKLFSAKWNIPKAALHCGMTWEDCMVAFRSYCYDNPPTYDKLGNLISNPEARG